MYRETAFERDGRHSNENARRVYLQRPLSQAEADVADLYTIIIMSFPRRSRTAQPISYAISSDDEDDKKRVVDLSDQEFENDESNSDDHSSDDEQAQSIAPSSSSPNFGGATGDGQQARHVQDPARRLDFDGSDGSPGAGSSSASRALYSSSEEEDARASENRRKKRRAEPAAPPPASPRRVAIPRPSVPADTPSGPCKYCGAPLPHLGAGPAHQHPRAPRRRVRPAGELGFLSRSIALFTAAHTAPPAFLFYQSSVVVLSSVDSHHHC